MMSKLMLLCVNLILSSYFFVNILHSTAVFDFFTSEILSLVIMRVPGLVGLGVKGVVGGQWVDMTCTNCTYLTQ